MQYALKYSSHQTVRPLAPLSPNGQTTRSSLTKRSNHSLVSHQTVKPLTRYEIGTCPKEDEVTEYFFLLSNMYWNLFP
jgi:hypothetical protein